MALARHGPPPDVPAASADHLDLHRALGRLAPRHREVLVLHYVASSRWTMLVEVDPRMSTSERHAYEAGVW